MNIKELFLKFGKKKELQSGKKLFTANSEDKNIYYIIDGEILLHCEGKHIALVGNNEIIGEKSFLQGSTKPINAISTKNTTIYYISNEKFSQISENEKVFFTKELSLFLSDRVYLLNDIITNLSEINEKISKIYNENISFDIIGNIFKNIIKLENIHVYKIDNKILLPIFESKLVVNYIEEIEKLNLNEFKIKNLKNKIIIKTNNYLFVLEGEKIKNDYIFNNIIIHIVNTLDYLGVLLENNNNQKLELLLKD